MAKYRTREGDMIDAVCRDYYGTSEGTVEEVLIANRELAQEPAHLPAGLIVELPDIQKPANRHKLVRLWQ